MEEGVFLRPAVAGLLDKNFIEARIHTDHVRLGAEQMALQKKLTDSISQPIYLIVDPKSGKTLRRLDNVQSEERFLQFLAGS